MKHGADSMHRSCIGIRYRSVSKENGGHPLILGGGDLHRYLLFANVVGTFQDVWFSCLQHWFIYGVVWMRIPLTPPRLYFYCSPALKCNNFSAKECNFSHLLIYSSSLRDRLLNIWKEELSVCSLRFFWAASTNPQIHLETCTNANSPNQFRWIN